MKSSSLATRQRTAGVLLHVTSLPNDYGIGDFGPQAYAWIDLLHRAKQTWWQILPLGSPAQGGSPYQCFSAFAGNPHLISPALLLRDGLIRRADLKGIRFVEGHVDFPKVEPFKAGLLALAWERFEAGAGKSMRSDYDRFKKREAEWLDDYALFMALKECRPAGSWTDWPTELVRRKPAALRAVETEFAEVIARHQFIQFIFHRQWNALRKHAHDRGVKLLGDLPIFVSGDSADVWAHSNEFLLDAHQRPKAVAGVPPDYFSKTGQRWGNPLYDWGAMKRNGYAWWVARVKATLAQVDLVRLDHFRGFAAAWHVPAEAPTAKDGKWVKGPGTALFETFEQKLGGLPLIAEDLGLITPDVEKLRDDFRLPGMRVLQFAFGGGADNLFLPHHYPTNSVAYTGTHDNDTTVGWFKSLNKVARKAVNRYLPQAEEDPAGSLIRLAWSSVANYAIAPLQDVLRLGSESRMNTPGTSFGNWGWRVTKDQLKRGSLDELGVWTETFGRG